MRLLLFLAMMFATPLLHANLMDGTDGESVLTDSSGNALHVDGFGNLTTTSRLTQISLTFEDNETSASAATISITGDATAVQPGNGTLVLTGNTSEVTYESREVIRYSTGIGWWAGGTFGASGTGEASFGLAMDDSVTGVRYGAYHTIDNGVFRTCIANDDGETCACEDPATNPDCTVTMSGALPSSLDLTKPHIYEWDAGYYGVRNITAVVNNPTTGGFDEVHTWETQGVLSLPHIGSPRLPMQAKVGAGSVGTFISMGAGIMGEVAPSRDEPNCYFNGLTALADSADEQVLVAFRVKTRYQGRENTIAARATWFNLRTDLDGITTFVVRGGPTITNSPTWNDAAGAAPVIEYSTDATITAGTGIPFAPSSVSGANKVTGSAPGSIAGLGLRGLPGDVFVVTAKREAGTGAFSAGADFCWVRER